jgi:hypothetical protein
MIKPLLAVPDRTPERLAGCNGCGQRRPLQGVGSIDFSDWKIWALAAAGALLVWLLLANTPAKQERAVKLRQARARFRGQLAKIREEYR